MATGSRFVPLAVRVVEEGAALRFGLARLWPAEAPPFPLLSVQRPCSGSKSLLGTRPAAPETWYLHNARVLPAQPAAAALGWAGFCADLESGGPHAPFGWAARLASRPTNLGAFSSAVVRGSDAPFPVSKSASADRWRHAVRGHARARGGGGPKRRAVPKRRPGGPGKERGPVKLDCGAHLCLEPFARGGYNCLGPLGALACDAARAHHSGAGEISTGYKLLPALLFEPPRHYPGAAHRILADPSPAVGGGVAGSGSTSARAGGPAPADNIMQALWLCACERA